MREGNKLTALKVEKLKKEGEKGFVSDGHNLYLKHGRSWVLRYMMHGTARWLGLGPIHTVSLAEARVRARQARQIILEGKDPLVVKRESVASLFKEAASTKTFKEAALLFLATDNIQKLKNAKHRDQWRSTLEEAFKKFGDLPLQQIDSPIILDTLLPIYKRAPETASRLRGRIERVFAWAKAHKLFVGDNPASRDVIKDALPSKPKAKHHDALPYVQLGEFMEKLREKESLSAKALEFTILTATRTSEVIGMRWDEIDFTHKVWSIPAERMKAKRDHRVPLSDRAIAVLSSIPRNGTDMPFPLSNMAMLKLVKAMTVNGYTVHGFRSTFSDWAHDCTSYPEAVIELAMAHKIKDKVAAAYRRGDALEKRAKLMQAWAEFTEMPSVSATVTPIRKERA